MWPDMKHDGHAVELAKRALGWDALTEEQKTASAKELLRRAQEYKDALKAAEVTGSDVTKVILC